MGTAVIKHPVTDRVKPSFVIFDIRTLWHSERQSARCQNFYTLAYLRLTLYAHCCHMGTAVIKHPVTDRVKPSFVIFDIRALWHSERQSARMSKIRNNCLTRSAAGCFIAAVPIWQQWASKG